MAADAHALIVQLGCVPSIVIGHSMGGKIAAHLAALYPDAVKALVILDEGADGPENITDIPPTQIPPVDKFTADWPLPYSTYEEALGDLRKKLGRETGVRYFLDSLVETYQGYDFLFSRYAMSAIEVYHRGWHDILASIECPVLLVRAVNSWCLSAEEASKMRSEIRDCTYFEVADSDHLVYADNPDEFYPQFEQFLRDVAIEPRVHVRST
jgi:pimeloyl-ACP methyl ester carboxylesterase